jgi:hypothetical protein
MEGYKCSSSFKSRATISEDSPSFEFLKCLLTSLSTLLCLEWVDLSVGSLLGTCNWWVRVGIYMYTLDQQFSKLKKWMLFLDGWLPKIVELVLTRDWDSKKAKNWVKEPTLNCQFLQETHWFFALFQKPRNKCSLKP